MTYFEEENPLARIPFGIVSQKIMHIFCSPRGKDPPIIPIIALLSANERYAETEHQTTWFRKYNLLKYNESSLYI